MTAPTPTPTATAASTALPATSAEPGTESSRAAADGSGQRTAWASSAARAAVIAPSMSARAASQSEVGSGVMRRARGRQAG